MSSEGAHMVARSHHHQRHSIKWEACRHAEFYQTLVLTTNNTLLGAVGPTKPGSPTHRFGIRVSGYWGLLASCDYVFFIRTRPKPAYGRQGLDCDRWARIQFSQVHFGAHRICRICRISPDCFSRAAGTGHWPWPPVGVFNVCTMYIH